MNNLTFVILFLLCAFPFLAIAQCQPNQYGFSICTGENALWEKSEKTFSKVKVVQLKYYETVIKDGRETLITDINKLVGNKICQEGDQYCKGQTIAISPECQENFSESDYKIIEVYQNGIIESEEGNIFNKKSILIPQNCVRRN